MTTSDDVPYQYKGVPLTPAIAQSIIRKLFSGKLVERQVIVEEVQRYHLAQGGMKSSAQSVGIVNQALSSMKEAGQAENRSKGYWRIQPSSPTISDLAVAEPELTPEQPESIQGREPAAEIDIGVGAGAVYVYYLPTYRLRAEERGERSWPCKIGRTDRDPLSRILSQAATALPERPHIALILRTAKPVAWESALHSVLTLRGLQIESSPGAEWFLTSPDEILALARSFDPTLFPDGNTKSSGRLGA